MKSIIFVIILMVNCHLIAIAQNQIEIKSPGELEKAVTEADPGDLILLADGNFDGESITVFGTGTAEKPVIIKAKNRGKTIIKSPLKIEGDYISLIGVNFEKEGKLEILGKGCRVSQCTWNDAKSGKWIIVLPGSSEIEIDRNTFTNKNSNKDLEKGCQLIQIVVNNKNEQHHIHHNLFKDIPKGKTGNGFETLQLITENNPFDPPPGHSNTVIEDNLFIRCNGESEIISVKSNGNIIRRNTFRACRGSLVLRHGDDNIVTQNYLFGDGEQGSGGVRIQGTGQIVANNYFQNLDFGLRMMDGTPDDLYIRVERAQILFNTFINCTKTFVIGSNHSKHPNGTTPKDCKIMGNILFSNSNNDSEKFIEFVQNDKPENWEWKDNVAFGNEVPEIKGIQNINPEIHLQKDGLAIPTNYTQQAKIVAGINDIVRIDLLGYEWKKNKTIGAIQFPFESSKSTPLIFEEVGAHSVK